MKPFLYFCGLAVLVFIGVASYRMDALVMAFAAGLFFGVLAGIPGSLLMLASMRKQDQRQPREQQPQMPFVVLGGGYQSDPLPPPPPMTIDLPVTVKKEIQSTRW